VCDDKSFQILTKFKIYFSVVRHWRCKCQAYTHQWRTLNLVPSRQSKYFNIFWEYVSFHCASYKKIQIRTKFKIYFSVVTPWRCKYLAYTRQRRSLNLVPSRQSKYFNIFREYVGFHCVWWNFFLIRAKFEIYFSVVTHWRCMCQAHTPHTVSPNLIPSHQRKCFNIFWEYVGRTVCVMNFFYKFVHTLRFIFLLSSIEDACARHTFTKRTS